MVKLVTDALEAPRRQVWQAARMLPDKRIAKTFKGARWALLKNPGDLTETQAATLKEMKRSGGILWRAYQLKEALREVFAGDLDPPPPATSSIAGARAPSAVASPSSSRQPAPSANTAPRSAGNSATDATRD